ncbi:MAG TPA: HipA N-terminal domain-containing protein, partial [Nitriliruptorales bacterium]
MSRTLHVWLYGEHVADAERASDGTLSLRYGERGHDVSTSMSSLVERHGHAHVAPWLAGLLPDNTAVLSRWATEFQVAPTPFALLGTAIGLDCAGAVQFTPGGVPLPVRRDSGVEWLDEDQLARVGEALYRDRTAWGGSRGTGRFSLAGAQSKVALRFEDGRYGQPFGDEPTNVIAKPSLPGFEGHDLNEHLCLDAARRCGVVAPP